MLNYVYPRAIDGKSVAPIDAKVVAPLIIAAREAGKTQKECTGILGEVESDDVHGFNALYKEIESERLAMAAVPIGGTQTAYLAELDKIKKHLDPNKYLAGKKAEAGVTTWTDLKAAVTPAEL